MASSGKHTVARSGGISTPAPCVYAGYWRFYFGFEWEAD